MVFDTNVLVHAADRRSPFHLACRARLNEARRQTAPAYLTWSVCYEFLRVTTHARVAVVPWDSNQAWGFIEALVESYGLQMLLATPRHAEVLRRTLSECPSERGNVMHDIHIAVLMRERGITRICTRDRDFARFPFLTVIDPTDDHERQTEVRV